MPDLFSSKTPRSRRTFLRQSAVAAIALPGAAEILSACKPAAANKPVTAAAPSAPAPALTAREKADAMDAMHEKGVKAFPARTAGKGNQLMKPRMVGGVKVYDITCREIDWEVEPGRKVKAWAYN